MAELVAGNPCGTNPLDSLVRGRLFPATEVTSAALRATARHTPRVTFVTLAAFPTMNHTRILTSIVLLTAALSAQTIQPPYDTVYGYTDLGAVPGVPGPLGGVTFKWNDSSRILVGGGANGPSGAIYEIGVTRNLTGSITGFVGTATLHSTAANIDGGLAYGPNGVLFYTAYSTNNMGQIKLGSTVPDRVDNLTAYGVGGSTGALGFVPTGFAGAGELKIASYSAGTFHGFTFSPDGNGTFNFAAANGPVTIGGGPEGILYVPPGSSLIPDYQYMLITEYGTGDIVLYQLDAVGNPIPASRVPFLTGLSGAEGACTDPVTGALVFSTYGGGDRIITVQGFGVCGSHQNYGAGIAGLNGVPTITGGGCAGRGQFTSVNIASGRVGAAGLLAVGFSPNTQPVLNGTLLVQIVSTYFHLLDPAGQWSLALYLPTDPVWNGLNIYTQGFYVDAAATFGVSATDGLHTLVR